ncbi:hypothetical protein BGZ92_007488 [Podila epicladia]|nr:hypothetical protein BGZ92_007488 [Podila epicladia]
MKTSISPYTVYLDTPIKRGTQTIETITLRKPCVREFSGISLVALANLEVDAMIRILPRISTPPLTEAEAGQLDAADVVALGGIVVGFLVKTPAVPCVGPAM